MQFPQCTRRLIKALILYMVILTHHNYTLLHYTVSSLSLNHKRHDRQIHH